MSKNENVNYLSDEYAVVGEDSISVTNWERFAERNEG